MFFLMLIGTMLIKALFKRQNKLGAYPQAVRNTSGFSRVTGSKIIVRRKKKSRVVGKKTQTLPNVMLRVLGQKLQTIILRVPVFLLCSQNHKERI